MQMIHTRTAFLQWVKGQITSAKPKKIMPCGFLETFDELFTSFEENGYFEFEDDEFTQERIRDFLNNIIHTQDIKIEASERIIEFIAEVYTAAIFNDDYVTFQQFIGLILRVLGLKPTDLVFGKMKGREFLISSPTFEERQKVIVEIRLTGDGDFVDLEEVAAADAESRDT